MSYEIVFLSPLRGLRQLIDKVCVFLGERNYTVVNCFTYDYGKGINSSTNFQQNKVIICKEFVVENLNTTDIPIIFIYASTFDVFYRLYLTSKQYKKIAFIAFCKEVTRYNFALFEEILGIEIKTFLYRSKDDVDQKIQEALDEKVEIVLTTGECVAKKIKSFNIPAHVIYPSKEVIIQAIYKAKEIFEIRRRDEYSNEILSKIINAVDDGIILLDQFNKVTLMNRNAEECLGNNNILDSLIMDVANVNCSEKVINIDKYRYLVTKRAISLDSDKQGTLITFRDVGEVQRLEYQIRRDMIDKGLRAKFVFDNLIGESVIFKKTIEKAKRYAKSDSTILITGESGTGKELFVQSIHNASNRRKGPFVGINCAALPESLLESELFGYEKGSFTGAEKAGKQGVFELAHKGTIFLDEIGEIPLSLQAKLLRVLQEKEVRRIGGDKIIPIDVRIIAATNRNLTNDIIEGRFRLDLYYRLNVLKINIPPLRERKEDIPLLLIYFLSKSTGQSQEYLKLSGKLINKLNNYSWPGNVRELEGFCERYLLLADDKDSLEEDFIEMFLPQNDFNINGDKNQESDYVLIRKNSLIEMEKEIIEKLLMEFNGQKNKVSKFLGISRSTLWKKLKEDRGVLYIDDLPHI